MCATQYAIYLQRSFVSLRNIKFNWIACGFAFMAYSRDGRKSMRCRRSHIYLSVRTTINDVAGHRAAIFVIGLFFQLVDFLKCGVARTQCPLLRHRDAKQFAWIFCTIIATRRGTIGAPGEQRRGWAGKHFGILRLIMLEVGCCAKI